MTQKPHTPCSSALQYLIVRSSKDIHRRHKLRGRTSRRPGSSRDQTALTTSASTFSLPMSAAAAANTLGILPTLACHWSFSTAHAKDCS